MLENRLYMLYNLLLHFPCCGTLPKCLLGILWAGGMMRLLINLSSAWVKMPKPNAARIRTLQTDGTEEVQKRCSAAFAPTTMLGFCPVLGSARGEERVSSPVAGWAPFLPLCTTDTISDSTGCVSTGPPTPSQTHATVLFTQYSLWLRLSPQDLRGAEVSFA